jgi:hypothetical protein
MAKINTYPSVDDTEAFTPAERAAFLAGANLIASGVRDNEEGPIAANIPLGNVSPTKLSDLTDDITQQTVVSNDTRPVSGAAVYTKLASFGGFQVVTKTSGANPVPDVASPDPKIIYLTSVDDSGTNDIYDEWIYTGDPTQALDPTKWERVGATSVDLTDYYTKQEADAAFLSSNTVIPAADGTTITDTSGTLSVAVPVPSTTSASTGDVLTKTSNGIGWQAIGVFSGSTSGLVPSATAGDADKALRGDGTWGDVSSVTISYDSVNEQLHLDFSPQVNNGGN